MIVAGGLGIVALTVAVGGGVVWSALDGAKSDFQSATARIDTAMDRHASVAADVKESAVHIEYLRKQFDVLNTIATDTRAQVKKLGDGQAALATKLDEIQSDIKNASLKQAMPAWAGFKYQIVGDPESAVVKLKSINATTKGMFDAGDGKWMMMYGAVPVSPPTAKGGGK